MGERRIFLQASVRMEGGGPGVQVLSGETLLQAMLRRGVPIAYSCQVGTCGSCRCRLVSGPVRELPFSPVALSEAQRAQGAVLACRLLALGHVVLAPWEPGC